MSIKKGGGEILRGGAYKPRTSPYSFQGMEEEGLKVLNKVGTKPVCRTVTEVVNPADVDLVES
jgi:3-deoxy-7-phosphoheptulonate synthase